MEAQTGGNKGETHSSSSVGNAQPQRDRKTSQRRGEKNGTGKTYYKTDLVNQAEPTAQIHEAADSSNQPSPEKRQNGQRQQANRSVYQPKGGNSSGNYPNDSNGSQSPTENGKARRPRSKQQGGQGQQKEDGGNRRSYQKKKDHENQQEEDGKGTNERFSNVSEQKEVILDPHRAQQLAEASRLQQIIPNKSISLEIQEKIKRIQEMFGKELEWHIIYGVLEDLGYDEDKTVAYFIDKRDASGQHERKQAMPVKTAPGSGWASVVKKGIKPSHSEEIPPEETKVAPQHPSKGHRPKTPPPTPQVNPLPNNQPNVHPANQPNIHSANQPNIHPANQPIGNQRSPIIDSLLSQQTHVDPEEIVSNLSSAIANQLKMIQEQTKMLTMMQSELSSITQSGSSEREKLLNEKQMMQERETELQQELAHVRERIRELDILLEENQKKKAERISAITSNGVVASLLKPIANTVPQPSKYLPQSGARINNGHQEK